MHTYTYTDPITIIAIPQFTSAMDLGHVISSLNKLDAADEEKIVLASRDGKNVLIVSFADVALCLEKAYQELVSNSVPHPLVQ
jgi:PAB-dependent poly(A)-specific ribonuclease subunit 3